MVTGYDPAATPDVVVIDSVDEAPPEDGLTWLALKEALTPEGSEEPKLRFTAEL